MQPAPIRWQGGVQVFDIDLDAFSQGADGERVDVLDENERARAARMATPLLRRRFAAAHGATRQVLGAMLGVDAGRLRFLAGVHGKPSLSVPDACGIHFNLSHCRGRALLAVADTDVGVDLEGWIERDTARLAADVLTDSELADFDACPPDRQPRELARLWAAKEALLKACGFGLQLAPQQVAVASGGGWHTLPSPADASPWWLQRIDIEGPFCAFVASRRCSEVTFTRLA